MKSGAVLLALVLFGGMSTPVLAAEVGGTVLDVQGKPVTGVRIIAKDVNGRVLGEASTTSKGTYNIQALQPGQYNFTLDPGPGRFQGQTVVSFVGKDGLCVNWGVSTNTPAIATAEPGEKCLPDSWDAAEFTGAGAAAVGSGAIAAAVATSVGGDDNCHPFNPDRCCEKDPGDSRCPKKSHKD
jgi:Carboxypeptidase regulatory-like domain